MPFKSQQQRKYMYSQHPQIANRWEKETPKGKKLPKKVEEGPGYDNQVGEIFIVQRPDSYDVPCQSLVHKADPVTGVGQMGLDPMNVYGAYSDENQAMQIAEKIHKEFVDAAIAKENKKSQVIDKIKETIDALEAQRSESVNMIKENPKDSKDHKDKIAHLASKIDDLMQKLERIESSKKEIVTKDDKKKEKSKK